MELTLTMMEKTETGLITILLGLGTVFVVLILLIFVVNLLKNIVQEKKEAVEPAKITPAVQEEPKIEETSKEDELQLIAVIAAALNAYLGEEKASYLRVRSIRRIASADNNWSVTGRNQTISDRQNLYRD